MSGTRPMLEPPPDRSLHAVVLMYHALANGAIPPGQDPHYTLGVKRFRKQLQSISWIGGGGCVRDWLDAGLDHTVLLTFDDGHVSNCLLAMPALQEYRMKADFFVNPANVGKRNFLDWPDLRQMHAAGMSIQCHGYDHVYLTDLDPRTLREQLLAARLTIEDRVGAAVTLLAPPGGRMPPDLADIALACGYRHVLSSRPGRISSSTSTILPRLSVTASLDESRFEAWISGEAAAIARLQLRYVALSLAKRLLGDSRYEQMRMHALPGRES